MGKSEHTTRKKYECPICGAEIIFVYESSVEFAHKVERETGKLVPGHRGIVNEEIDNESWHVVCSTDRKHEIPEGIYDGVLERGIEEITG